MTRVLHVSNSQFGSISEAGHTLRIWRELAAGAEEYHVLARNSRLRYATERSGNLTLHRVPGVRSALFPLLAYQAGLLAWRRKIDVILCQDPVLGGVAAVQLGAALSIPVMIEIHTDRHIHNMRSPDAGQAALGRIARYALRRADRVRIVSRSFAEPLLSAGVAPERLVYLPTRVDTRLFKPDAEARARGRDRLGAPPSCTVVLGTGRFVPQKGFAELARAFSAVRERVPGSRLVLVGGGPLEATYLAAADAAGVGDALTLVPWVDQRALADLYAAADVYAQPSIPGLGEAMPRTILEAMASGLPVVATSVAGIPDVLRDGRTGVLVEPGDTASLVEALVRLAGDAVARERLGGAARDHAMAEYDWDRHFHAYRLAVAELAEGEGRAP